MNYEEMAYYVVPLSQNLKRLFPMVDLQEIQQEMYEWFAKNPEAAERYHGHEDEKQGNRLISASLLNRARRFCQTEKAARLGYSARDVAYYTVGQISDLLPQVYDVESWMHPPKVENGQSGSKQDPAWGGNHLASLADVADAIRKLDLRTQSILKARFMHDYQQSAIANVHQVSDATISDLLSKAPARIQALLGGPRPVHTRDELSRRVVSNTHAQATTRGLYDD